MAGIESCRVAALKVLVPGVFFLSSLKGLEAGNVRCPSAEALGYYQKSFDNGTT